MTGTRRWLRRLKLPVVRSWQPWRSATGQIGGYFERYAGLTFVTIRNAGHMVCLKAPFYLNNCAQVPPVLTLPFHCGAFWILHGVPQ